MRIFFAKSGSITPNFFLSTMLSTKKAVVAGGAFATLATTTQGTRMPCAGRSIDLEPEQCQAWQDLFDSTAGMKWTGVGAECTKSDPCDGCSSGAITCDGVSKKWITKMCATQPPSFLPRSLLPAHRSFFC